MTDEFHSTVVHSVRVKKVNDWNATKYALFGWQLIDVTYDPHTKDWVYTYQIRL